MTYPFLELMPSSQRPGLPDIRIIPDDWVYDCIRELRANTEHLADEFQPSVEAQLLEWECRHAH